MKNNTHKCLQALPFCPKDYFFIFKNLLQKYVALNDWYLMKALNSISLISNTTVKRLDQIELELQSVLGATTRNGELINSLSSDVNASSLKVNIYRLRQVKCKWAALPVLTQTLAKQLCRCLANLAVNK